MQNALDCTFAVQPTMNTTYWVSNIFNVDTDSIIANVQGNTKDNAEQRARLLVDAFNNAKLGPFLP